VRSESVGVGIKSNPAVGLTERGADGSGIRNKDEEGNPGRGACSAKQALCPVSTPHALGRDDGRGPFNATSASGGESQVTSVRRRHNTSRNTRDFGPVVTGETRGQLECSLPCASVAGDAGRGVEEY
jgi:hypothetical protein